MTQTTSMISSIRNEILECGEVQGPDYEAEVVHIAYGVVFFEGSEAFAELPHNISRAVKKLEAVGIIGLIDRLYEFTFRVIMQISRS